MMDTKLQAFLSLVAWSEGTSEGLDNGYGVIVKGVSGPSTFTDYSKHPFEDGGSVLVRVGPPALYSTAAGRYQILARFWRIYKAQLGLPDFSPASQDAVALQMIKERGAIPDIEAGEVELAISLCSNIWASLPGNTYGQGGHSMDALVQKYAVISTPGPEAA